MPKDQVEYPIGKTAGDHNKTTKPPSAPKAQESTALWRRNHKIVNDLFDEYEKVDIRSRKMGLVSRICVDLSLRTQVEEALRYPAVNEIPRDKRFVRQVIDKRAMLEGLIAGADDMEADGDDFDAKVKALSDFVKDHVKEEQDQMISWGDSYSSGRDWAWRRSRVAQRATCR